jgi:pyruvate formate lyase activating enzyme
LDRRQFLADMARLGLILLPAACHASGTDGPGGVHLPPREAEYYVRNADGSVTCQLCPHHETLRPGQTGRCQARTNVGGILKTYAVGQPCVLNPDPIEKSPMNHALPGATLLALAHAGCNLRCQYCQNFQFSQQSPAETKNLEFDTAEALGLAQRKTLQGIVFTYTEGTTHIEFNKRFAAAARARGLRTFLCTNGYIRPEPLADFLQVLDGVTVTVKGFSDDFYREYIGATASFRAVLDSCRQIRKAGKWLEVATLIVPGLNDSPDELTSIARWMRQELGPDTPWHLERFMPKYKLANRPQTPAATLENALAIGRREGLRFVYLSNLAPHPANSTYCPRCQAAVISRLGFKVLRNDLLHGVCPKCHTKLPGIWS